MSIVFTVQSEERVLCTSKPLIWEAVQWGWGGEGERGQEIRIGVINNFCSVINQRRGIPLPPRYTPVFVSSALFSFTTVFFHPKCSLSFGIKLFFSPQCCWSYIIFKKIYIYMGDSVMHNLCILCLSYFNDTINLFECLSFLKLNLYFKAEALGNIIIHNYNESSPLLLNLIINLGNIIIIIIFNYRFSDLWLCDLLAGWGWGLLVSLQKSFVSSGVTRSVS